MRDYGFGLGTRGSPDTWFTCVAEPSQISVDTRGRVNTDSSPKSEEILAQLSGDPDGPDLAGSVS